MTAMTDTHRLKRLAALRERLVDTLHQRIVGQDKVLDQILVALLCRGHGMINGVPGLGKTLLVRSLAEVLELKFSRIQFTPDLMPSDVTGTEVIEEDRNTGHRRFKFVPGPVFTNLLLADEVNRTPPKTQAALLQAMQEGHVTVMGQTYPIERPFHVFATQNPIEHEGTYPLPEALLDRFMLSVHIDYPTAEEEGSIVRLDMADLPRLPVVITLEQLREAQDLLSRVPVPDAVVALVVKLTRATRPDKEAPALVSEYVSWGAGPRAAQFLLLAAKARALLDGEPAVLKEHVTQMAVPVLRHRLVLNFRAETERVQSEQLIEALVKHVA